MYDEFGKKYYPCLQRKKVLKMLLCKIFLNLMGEVNVMDSGLLDLCGQHSQRTAQDRQIMLQIPKLLVRAFFVIFNTIIIIQNVIFTRDLCVCNIDVKNFIGVGFTENYIILNNELLLLYFSTQTPSKFSKNVLFD
eukprot:TRINITY_DN7529_c0_g1_i11.p5 TRINITY_DN7529_c0_g1~~TRINITY_DN7529_c0_g1_i11.p5  ORF type:complete len:136 (+),score=2.72 TRINITY_DN7529_c0_g1_i11:441-848(+)